MGRTAGYSCLSELQPSLHAYHMRFRRLFNIRFTEGRRDRVFEFVKDGKIPAWEVRVEVEVSWMAYFVSHTGIISRSIYSWT